MTTSTGSQPLVSVLIPMIDARGEAAEHLRSWTEGQSLPRERFQLVIATHGDDPEPPPGVATQLGPDDVVAPLVDSRYDSHYEGGALYNHAAEQASAPWLLITENHCLADPECLTALTRAIESERELDVFTLKHSEVTVNDVARLLARWFDALYDEWQEYDWKHLNAIGFAIRRSTYLEAGGLDPDIGTFGAQVLSARLHELGARVGHVQDAVVLHKHNAGLREHHDFSADHARGEFDARTTLDPRFAERYFGEPRIWTRRTSYRPDVARRLCGNLAIEAARALVRRRGDLPWIARELATHLPAAVAGVRPYVFKEWISFVLNEFAAERLRFLGERRWPRLLNAQESVVRLTHLRWIRDNPEAPARRPEDSRWSATDLGGQRLAGAYPLEHNDQGAMRWTEPVAQLLLPPSPGRAQLAVDTGGVRGAPLRYVSAVYLGVRRVPRRALREEGGRLIVPLPEGASSPVTLLSRPLVPATNGSSDMRRLGMPVFSVELSG